MIGTKFRSNCPSGFLEKIEFLEESKYIYFACDFEFSESMTYEEKIFYIGKFHSLDKETKNYPNCRFINLANRDHWDHIEKEIKSSYLETIDELLLRQIATTKSDHVDVFEFQFASLLSSFLLCSGNQDDIFDILKNHSKELNIKQCDQIDAGFDIKEIKEIESFLEQDLRESDAKLLIPNFQNGTIIRVVFQNKIPNRVFIAQILLKSIQPNTQDETLSEFEEITYPIAVIKNDTDVIYSNEKFIDLGIGINGLAALKNGEIKSGHSSIIIEEISSLKETKVYLFMPVNELGQDVLSQSSEEELGIICSSIAHELNNPIGGIINAFQLLNVLNDFDEGTKEIVNEMTKSIERAHHLVNLFLGFVKTDIHKKENQEINPCLNQAVDLLRGRMVKEGCFIHVDFLGEDHRLKFNFNHSVMTIVFYIISSDLLTRFARETLVKNTNQNEKSLSISISRENNILKLKTNNLNYQFDVLKDSHLLKYLVQSQKIHLNFDDDEIGFIWP